MANTAQIQLEFTGVSDLNASFQVKFVNTSRSIDVTFTWTCKTLRTLAFQYTQGADIIEQTDNLFDAGNADISNSSISAFIFTGGIDDDTVTFEADEFGWVITDEGSTGTTNITPLEVPEVLPTKNFELLNFSLATAAAPCADIQVTITENDGVPAYSWVTPINVSTSLVADIARTAIDQLITVTLEDSEADQATLNNVAIPRLFSVVEILDISVVTNIGGLDATVTVFMATEDFGTYQFSLDGSNFQLSNVFPAIVDGSYTLYVNDGYGCLINTDFDVDVSASIQAADPIAIVPTANSMRMIQRVTTRFNTLSNTLYQDEFFYNETKHRYEQLYQTNDGVIITQFQTNYTGLSVKILDCDGNTISTPSPVKKSDNLAARDTRDCNVFNLGNNQTGIFFTDGNTYDPGTTDINGSYELFGTLPDWGVVGNTVVLTGGATGSFLIKQITFDSTVQAEVLVIDNIWTSGNQSEVAIADVTYNRLPTEDYEYNVDLSTLSPGVYRNELLLTDARSNFPDIAFESERYRVAFEHKRTAWIDYFDSPGTGINYDTGYEGHIRLRANTPEAKQLPAGEVVAFADSGGNIQKVKDSPLMTGEMWMEGQPRYMIEKLRLIFAHKSYSVNEIEYQNEDALEVVEVPDSSLNNATIVLQQVDYEAYKEDNIIVDGPTDAILHETGPILQ